jgi:hypothetical protein
LKTPDLTDQQRAALAQVRETWGDDPQAVGVEDGSEDDFGDLVSETFEALGFDLDEAGDDTWQRALAAATYCDSENLEEWARVMLGAALGEPEVVEPLRRKGLL